MARSLSLYPRVAYAAARVECPRRDVHTRNVSETRARRVVVPLVSPAPPAAVARLNPSQPFGNRPRPEEKTGIESSYFAPPNGATEHFEIVAEFPPRAYAPPASSPFFFLSGFLGRRSRARAAYRMLAAPPSFFHPFVSLERSPRFPFSIAPRSKRTVVVRCAAGLRQNARRARENRGGWVRGGRG